MSDYTPLPGEGDTRTEVRKRHICAICGAPATRRVTYLLQNCRSNPASSAYCHDDCTYCADAESFACEEHLYDVERDAPFGMSWAATFDGARQPHQLLYWKSVKGEAS